MLLSKCSLCDSKKMKFIKHQEASGLLNILGVKTLLSKITRYLIIMIIAVLKTRICHTSN